MTSTGSQDSPRQFTAFVGQRLIASGPLSEVLPRARAAAGDSPLIFADDNGDLLEPDWRMADLEILAALEPGSVHPASDKRVGRPKLGVVAREVTLLPRHWDWLSDQSGGASAALRRLVEQARRDNAGRDHVRRARRAVDRFMYRMAGDLPHFEEAYRALYADDLATLLSLTDDWPTDLRDTLRRLAAALASSLQAE